MAERQVQRRDRAIPQLSCALCRDRKLKCDKLDPCTNCTASGVKCVPVYRPRLPRGRHARRSRNNPPSKSTTPPPSANRRQNTIDAASAADTSCSADSADSSTTGLDLGSRLGRLETLVHGGDVAKMTDESGQGVERDSDLTDRISRLENLVHSIGPCANSLPWPGRDCLDMRRDSSRRRPLSVAGGVAGGSNQLRSCRNIHSVELTDDAQLAAASLPSPSSWKPEFSVGSDHDEGGCMAQSGQFWGDLMYEDGRRGEQGMLPLGETHDEDGVMDDLGQEYHSRDGIRQLNLLGLTGRMSVRSLSPPGFPSGNKSSMSRFCGLYLRNVDPIIKILHRPTLSKWMQDGDRYLGYPEDHTSIQALESAVCYAAANTLNEAQCLAMFHTSKSTLVSTSRRRCEVAIERAGLLTTRDRIVLQSFVLYLVGRRSEEKGTAVWTLVALAVRLTIATGLCQEPSDGTAAESFFHQQMRLRLWLTICLLDLQASFAQSTKPLISHHDAEVAISKVRHINDSDFDLSTSGQVPDREGLTETTFALVTYRAQVAERLLNFSEAAKLDVSNSTSASSPAWTGLTNQEQRRKYVSQFQQQALVLLHFCDPESSSYAWFTWHSTQCLVSAMRLAELLPYPLTSGLQTPAIPPPSLRCNDTDLLRRSLQTLEKAQLMYSDPRGEGFRWYITIPWLALSTAIAECNTCTDTPLVCGAWPVIEASYQQYESFFLKNGDAIIHCPLAMAMSQTREGLLSRLRAGSLSEQRRRGTLSDGGAFKASAQPFPDPFSRGSSQTPVDPLLGPGTPLPTRSSPSSEASYIGPPQLYAHNSWNPNSLSLEYTPALGGSVSTSNMYHSLASSELLESSWMVGDIMSAYLNLEDEAMVRNGDRDGKARSVFNGSTPAG